MECIPTSLEFELNTWLYKEDYLKLGKYIISKKSTTKGSKVSFLVAQARNLLVQPDITSDIPHLMLWT